VTAQMLANFVRGGAAVCVLAREARARLVVVDAGVIGGAQSAGARSEIVDGVRGTDDLTLGPAMSRSTAIGAIERGIALAGELAGDGVEIVGLGEMGIGNTTAASALTAASWADPSGVRTTARRRGPRAQGRRGARLYGERSAQSRCGPVDVLVHGLEIALAGVCPTRPLPPGDPARRVHHERGRADRRGDCCRPRR
jgi:nicotinate-nucleotide--dimethylbenzimidazole phosphoribosyltransferase